MDVLRLYSFKGDALSWSVRDCGTSGPPQRSYSQRNTVGVEACRRGGGARRGRNRALGGTITTTNWLTGKKEEQENGMFISLRYLRLLQETVDISVLQKFI